MLSQTGNEEPEEQVEKQNRPATGLAARNRIPLDGTWNFCTDPEAALSLDSLPVDSWLEIKVPSPWQPQFPELNSYAGAAWYQRSMEISGDWLEKNAIFLGIDASDYFTEAWLNGEKVGEHEGGYLPFEFDVTSAALPGLNTLTIRVDDPPRLFPEIPHGKQGWYGPLSGLWQSVWLERRSTLHIQDLHIPDWERVAYWSGERIEIGLQIANNACDALEPAELRWSLGPGLSGRVTVPALQPSQVKAIEKLVFQAPEVQEPNVQRLWLELRSASGEKVTANYVDLSLYPPRPEPGKPGSRLNRKPVLYCEDELLSRRLRALGYALTTNLNEAYLAVTVKAVVELLVHLRSGGRLLVLADRAGSDGQLLPGIRIESRRGTPWVGDWASAFSWVSRLGPFSGLPGGPLVDHSFDRVIPQTVLTGFRDWDFRSLVHAGIVVGWVHKPAVLIAERFYGKGKAVLNTFNLDNQALGNDPTATALFDGLIALTIN